jgi:3-oxoacyl-[acyl-carrier protein] reductase
MTQQRVLPSRLEGRVAIVTGAGHGIGQAYAYRLASDGAQVVAADIDGDAAVRVAADLNRSGYQALGVPVDIGDESAVKDMVAAAIDRFNRVDVLVNNASTFLRVPMAASTIDLGTAEDFDRLLHVNVVGTWLCCRAVVPDMRSRGYGKIINISSTRALRSPSGRPSQTHYSASKAAVLGMTRALARELGESGIRVNSVAPGSTLSQDDLTAEDIAKASAKLQSQERALGGVQRSEDLVGTISFLASADSDFITGQTFVVDGGALMH